MAFQWQYQAEVLRVVDGDTYDLRVDLGFGTIKEDRFRLLGVDTDEVYGVPKESEEYQRGKEQSRFVRNWLDERDELIVETHKDEAGKYGRYLCDIIDVDGNRLSDAILDEFPSVENN